MTAPLPMRFYNPIKDLCLRTNLDYDTVIENCVQSSNIRNALMNAEIPKPIQEYTEEEKKLINLKISEQNNKYPAQTEIKDKGRERYDMGITVEYMIPDDKKEDLQDGNMDTRYTKDGVKYLAPPAGYKKWIPGKSNE